MADLIHDDFIHEDRSDEPLPSSNHRTGPTGPRTPAGKAKSSRNSFKHGCRSAKTVLLHEDPAEFEATVQGWFTAYHPETQPAVTLVENLARAHWVLKRNEKRLEDVEWELPANAYDWTDEHHKQYATTNRYKTTAERSFLRNFKEVEAHYHRLPPRRSRPPARLRQTRQHRIQTPRQS